MGEGPETPVRRTQNGPPPPRTGNPGGRLRLFRPDRCRTFVCGGRLQAAGRVAPSPWDRAAQEDSVLLSLRLRRPRPARRRLGAERGCPPAGPLPLPVGHPCARDRPLRAVLRPSRSAPVPVSATGGG